jgi:hypothetical protein
LVEITAITPVAEFVPEYKPTGGGRYAGWKGKPVLALSLRITALCQACFTENRFDLAVRPVLPDADSIRMSAGSLAFMLDLTKKRSCYECDIESGVAKQYQAKHLAEIDRQVTVPWIVAQFAAAGVTVEIKEPAEAANS